MLVLSRQRDETIMIGDDVEITIVDIRGDKVRLGINAPRSIQVHRKEVYDAIKRENEQSSKLNPRDVADVLQHEENDKKSNSEDAGPYEEKPAGDKKKDVDDPHQSNHVGRSR